MSMQMIPNSVGVAAQGWDEESLDLGAASGQIGGAGSGGFTDAVRGAAATFLRTWEGHVRTLGEDAEAQADGLRTTIADWLATDAAQVTDLARLRGYLVETR